MANLDDDWKPNGRPQSTIAQDFSASLHNVFDIDNNLGDLTQSVEDRKKTVDDRTRELEALEARIRETEERLRDRQSRNNSPVGRSSAGGGSNSPHRRHPPGSNFNGLDAYGRQPIRSSPLAGQRQPRDDALDTDQAATGAGSQAGSAYNGTHRQSPSGYRKPVGSSLNQ